MRNIILMGFRVFASDMLCSEDKIKNAYFKHLKKTQTYYFSFLLQGGIFQTILQISYKSRLLDYAAWIYHCKLLVFNLHASYWTTKSCIIFRIINKCFGLKEQAHLSPNSKFNFHKYIKRSLEDDFKVVVGISYPLWIFAVMFMLLNVYGKQL